MPRLSWALLLGAIAVATATVTILATFGPDWPGMFGSCGAEQGVHEGGPARDAAIADWKDWWRVVYWTGLAVSGALIAGWAWAARFRPGRRSGIALAAVAAALGASLLMAPRLAVYAAALFAIAWSFLLGFPRLTFVIAPALCVTTVVVARMAAGFDRGGQRVTQLTLVAILISAWAALGVAGGPSPGAFAC